jgi:pimeloyl-ACP methyl ester carboxylesterase
VPANGIEIAYESFGPKNGEAIILIQGTGAQLTLWPKELCERLTSDGYRVIRFDNRDVGLSSHLDSLGTPEWGAIVPKIGTCDTTVLSYTLMDMANDVIGLMDGLEIKKANIVGISMGSAIAQLVALTYPKRTKSLGLIASSSGNPELPPADPEVLKMMSTPPPVTDDIEVLTEHVFRINKALSSSSYSSDEKLKELARCSIERSWYPEGTARHVAAIAMGCDRRGELKKLKMPVVVIHGDEDPIVNLVAGKELSEIIPNANLVIMPEMAHDLPYQLVDS